MTTTAPDYRDAEETPGLGGIGATLLLALAGCASHAVWRKPAAPGTS